VNIDENRLISVKIAIARVKIAVAMMKIANLA